jgi:hypothetical protein
MPLQFASESEAPKELIYEWSMKALLNSSVLSVRLKVLKVLHERQLYDNEFQTAGPETEKALYARASFRAGPLIS